MRGLKDNHSQPSRSAAERLQFSLRGLLVFIGVFCAGCALVFSAIRAAREADRRSRCKARLTDIAVAVCEYHDTYGCFPPPFFSDAAGKPLYSWRVRVNQLTGAANLALDAYNFGLPWNDPSNLRVSGSCGDEFQCPSVRYPRGTGCTDYVMVLGEKTATRAGGAPSAVGHDDQIIIVEIPDSDIYWTEPRDLVLGEMRIQINDESKPGVSIAHGHRAVVFSEEEVPRTISLHGRRSTFYLTDYTLESKKARSKE